MLTEIAAGLRQTPKTLSSKFFYDEAGSQLFQQIMALPEYYPTRTEFSILEKYGPELVAQWSGAEPLLLLELGAGDGLKTKLLLRALLAAEADFTYSPVDISASAVQGLADSLRQELPALQVAPVVAEYEAALDQLRTQAGRKAVLFLGSNIGNFHPVARQQFLATLAAPLAADDVLLIGFDLQKNPRQIRAAYDDAQGVTAAFNLNLLTRLNRELGADFELANWQHYTDYDPLTGAVRSYLVSTCAQRLTLSALPGETFEFAPWEVIHTENSYKFTRAQIEALAAAAGLQVQHFLTDEEGWFADVVLTPMQHRSRQAE
jgi:L-histidine N-alpha-methyltransferase